MVRVYLINLDGSDDRLRNATEQLAAEGLAFERVAAFDGRKISVDEFPGYDARAALRYLGRPMRGGEIGCYLSHLDCARRFLETSDNVCIVLEDDLSLTPGFAESVEQILDWLSAHPVDWDLINLGAVRQKIYTRLHGFDVERRSHVLTRAHYFPMLATGLIWSRAGAEAFVGRHTRIVTPVDIHFRYWQTRAGRGLSVIPPLLTASGVDSLIASSDGPKRSAGGRHPLYGLIRQYRMLTDKLIALRHRLSA